MGLRVRVGLANLSAPPLRAVVAFLRPLATPMLGFLEQANRLLTVGMKEERGITPEVLSRVMERGAEDKAIDRERATVVVPDQQRRALGHLVEALDGRPVGCAAPGPVTEKIAAAFAAATRALGTPIQVRAPFDH